MFNDAFAAHGEPEVLATPLEGVALTMRALGIDRVRARLDDIAGPAAPRRLQPRRACARGPRALAGLWRAGASARQPLGGESVAGKPKAPAHLASS